MNWKQWLSYMLIAFSTAGAAGYTAGREAGRRQAQDRFDRQQYVAQAYIDSCEALTAAAARVLETNRQHMLLSHGMEFVEGKGWVQR